MHPYMDTCKTSCTLKKEKCNVILLKVKDRAISNKRIKGEKEKAKYFQKTLLASFSFEASFFNFYTN